MAAVQAYDSATDSIEALNAAELKFQDIIDSPSVDAACRKIDHLAEKNQLDSALVMMITKAWSAAKESSMTKDEVDDGLPYKYLSKLSCCSTIMANQFILMHKETSIILTLFCLLISYTVDVEVTSNSFCFLINIMIIGDPKSNFYEPTDAT